MARQIIKILLMCSPFLFISALMFYFGFTTKPGEVIDDGTDKRTFFFIMGGSFLAIISVLGTIYFVHSSRRERNLRELAEIGEHGTATVLSVTDTGSTTNNAPRVILELEIHLPNRPSVRAKKTINVPLIHIPQVQKGSTIKVLADPNELQNENRIEILF